MILFNRYLSQILTLNAFYKNLPMNFQSFKISIKTTYENK